MPRLSHRRAALFATLVAVALGAALASAGAGLFATGVRPAQQVTLSERGHLPAGTLEAVRATPGVTDAHLVPDLGAIAVRTTDPTALHPAGMQAASSSHPGVRPRYASRMQAGGGPGVLRVQDASGGGSGVQSGTGTAAEGRRKNSARNRGRSVHK